MATCKARFPRARLSLAKKFAAPIALGSALSLLGTASFAQSARSAAAQSAPVTPVAPVQPITLSPSVTMPSMPKISAPVAGSSFYTPGNNFQSKKDAAAQSQSAAVETKKSAASSDLETSLLSGVGSDFSGLTAQDLVQMAKSGSITSVTSLLGTSNFYKNSSSGAADNQVLLKKILNELDEIKKSQRQTLASAATGTKPSSLPPKILRFIVNANDVLSKCVQVYFSDRESDGSFLLTGDAKTLFNNENISETFYLLFKACGTKNSKTIYTVTPTLSQSAKADTPLGKFCASKSFEASRVGNLVTLHSLQGGTMADLLLDIGIAR